MTLTAFPLAVQVLLVAAASVVLVPLGAWLVVRAWHRPSLAVAGMILLTAVPWRTGDEGQALLHVTLADVASVVLVGVVAGRVLWQPSSSDERRLASWVMLPLLGLLLASTVSTFFATDPLASFSGAVRQTQMLVAVPVAAYLSYRRRADVRLVLAAVLTLGVVQGLIGITQYVTGTGASFGGEDVRAVGTFGAYNIMALPGVVAAALMVCVAIVLVHRGAPRIWAVVGMTVLVPALGMSLSRGYWVATAFGVLAVVAIVDRRKAALLVLAGVFGLTGLLAMAAGGATNPVVDRLVGTTGIVAEPDQSVQDRYALWAAARGMSEDNPVTGVGIKNFADYRDSYVDFNFSGVSDIADAQGGFRQVSLLTPHNLYLLVLSEQGLIGAVAYLAFFASLGLAAASRVARELRDDNEPLVQVLGLAAVGLLLTYLTGAIYGDPGGAVGLMDSALVFGGLLFLASGSNPDDTKEPGTTDELSANTKATA